MTLLHDLRAALRSHRRTAAVSLSVVVTLALGIGVTAAVFSVVSAQLVRSLPVPEPETLFALGTPEPSDPVGRRWVASLPDVRDLRSALGGEAWVAAWSNGAGLLDGPNGVERIDTLEVEPELLSVLRVAPLLGRTFLPDEGRLGGPRAVVLTEESWRRRFHADPSVVGRVLTLDAETYEIVGVLPSAVRFPLHTAQPELWVPLVPRLSGPAAEANRKARWLQVTGRLGPRTPLQRVEAAATAVMARLEEAHPDTNRGVGAVVEPLRDRFTAKTRRPLLLLLAAAGAVLLLACANASNLLLARALGRRGELAVRTALGAPARRLLTQFVAEGLWLGGAGAALGLLLAAALLELLSGFLPRELSYLNEIRVDGWVIAVSMLLALGCAAVMSLAPAWNGLRVHPQDALKAAGAKATASARTVRLLDGLVITQTAFAAVLLIAGGLFVHSALRLSHVHPGFEARGLFSAMVTLYDGGEVTEEEVVARNERLLAALSAAPELQGAAAAFPSAFGSGAMRMRAGPLGTEPAQVSFHTASPGFFSVMGTRLLQGREFTSEDRRGGVEVVVVNARLAQLWWPGQDPLGQQLAMHLEGEERRARVVGVVEDVLHVQLDGEALPQLYAPQAQWPMPRSAILVRSTLAPHEAEQLVRRHVRAIAPKLPVDRPDPVVAAVARSVAQRSFQTLLIVSFALLALLIAAHGVYAVTAYSVARRTREVGIRTALGASPRQVFWLILRRVGALTAAGVAAGCLASLLLADTLQAQLFQTRADDPLSIAALCGLLLTVAVGAGLPPALRAARVDPALSLQRE